MENNGYNDEPKLISAGFVMRGQVDNVAAACDAIEDLLKYYKIRLVYRKASSKKLWVVEGDEKGLPPALSVLVRTEAEKVEEITPEPSPEESEEIVDDLFPEPVTEQVIKEIKKRGRPKGSKNKPRDGDAP
jgi:hypothetical protein